MSRYFSTKDGAPGYIGPKRVLYERKPVTDLWNTLTVVARQQWKWKNVVNKHDDAFLQAKTRLLQVYGPPGSGKTCATFGWARSVCEKCSGTRALWISCAAEAVKCWSIEREQGTGTVVVREQPTPQNANEAGDAMIVVFDGVRPETLNRWRGLMNEIARLGIAVIAVSSEGVFFHEGDSQDILKVEHFVPSWTLEEALAASNSNVFWQTCYRNFSNAMPNDDATQRNAKVQAKFWIAGNSARFLFDSPESIVEDEIKAKARSLNGIDTLEHAVGNPRSRGAVNTLIARLQEDKNGLTPEQRANFPMDADLLAVAEVFDDLNFRQEEMDNEDSVPQLVSAYASGEVSSVFHQPSQGCVRLPALFRTE